MKEAKAEADQIISAYRKELEASYQANLSKVNSIFVITLSRNDK